MNSIPSFQTETHAFSDDFSRPLMMALPPGYGGKLFLPEKLPDRIIQSVRVQDIGAFEDYLSRYIPTYEEQGAPENAECKALAIYCSTDRDTFVAYLDHHGTPVKPGTNQHSVTLKMEYSEEFAPLRKVFGNALTQEQFLDFLEEHATLFVEAAALQQIIETFENVQVTRFKSGRNLSNGMVSLVYDTAELAGESTKVPAEVTVVCPIYKGQKDRTLKLRLRYVSGQGGVVFKLLCHEWERIHREEIEAVELRIREFAKGNGWVGALIVRGTVEGLTQPAPAKDVAWTAPALPSPLLR